MGRGGTFRRRAGDEAERENDEIRMIPQSRERTRGMNAAGLTPPGIRPLPFHTPGVARYRGLNPGLTNCDPVGIGEGWIFWPE
jgi:hypothetical protein